MRFHCNQLFVACAVQVNSAWLRGDQDEAHRCSRQARLWNIVGIVVGVVMLVVSIGSASLSAI